ncbi:MAG TPA: (4Fe-4S)-binding protein [Bacteroidota bacterium]|nr:(4Fe-4S)-binding protein [Bacteroidota bacterium]
MNPLDKQPTIKYTNGGVTVLWRPHVCIHSTKCWKGLLSVFNPSVKPWINMDGATTERIIDQVEQCPSGALQYRRNENEQSETTTDTTTD